MLKDELAQIVEAENASSQRLSACITAINKEKQTLQDKLYQELKDQKGMIQEEQRHNLASTKDKIQQWYDHELEKMKQESLVEYQEITQKKCTIIEELTQYMWQVSAREV